MISGELFECRLETEVGAIEVLAEVRVDGTLLELHDIVVYPATDHALAIGAASLLAAARSQVFSEFVLLGFETLLVTGTRLTGSRPGRRVQIRIDLLREVS